MTFKDKMKYMYLYKYRIRCEKSYTTGSRHDIINYTTRDIIDTWYTKGYISKRNRELIKDTFKYHKRGTYLKLN